LADAEAPIVRIAPGQGGVLASLGECWGRREMLYFLAWRDVKVRYKQTVLGVLWAVLQPLVSMVVLTLIFNRVGGIKPPEEMNPGLPEGVKYMLFAYAGLLPWMLFQSALVQSSNSIVNSAHLLTKVYFPRLLVPLSSVVSGLVDFGCSFVVLVGMMVVLGIQPRLALLWLPVFVVLAVVSALAVGVWFSALNAKYRDFRYVVPFMAQIWMFLSPVAYSSADLQGKLPSWLGPLRWLYDLNPMVGVVEGFRWALFGQPEPQLRVMAASLAGTAAILVGGLLFFRRMERVFADLV
jgi:lipopolysaccharide transport system permease protein